MNFIVLDLEATCWQDRSVKKPNEIIEIGAVKIDRNQHIVSEYNAFIKPKLHPQLSDFCTELTTITQGDIDAADPFNVVMPDFLNWIDPSVPFYLCSWGFYDKTQFTKDCELHNLPTDWLQNHISVKHQYADINQLKRPTGMMGALKKEGILPEGTHHRGIDDARNIAKIFLQYFDRWKV